MSATVEEIDDLITKLKNIRARIGVDPDLKLARDIVAARVRRAHHPSLCEIAAHSYRKGDYDESIAVQSALAGIKAGRKSATKENTNG